MLLVEKGRLQTETFLPEAQTKSYEYDSYFSSAVILCILSQKNEKQLLLVSEIPSIYLQAQ